MLPFNTCDCLIEVTAWEGLSVYYTIISITYRLLIQKKEVMKSRNFKKFSKTGQE